MNILKTMMKLLFKLEKNNLIFNKIAINNNKIFKKYNKKKTPSLNYPQGVYLK